MRFLGIPLRTCRVHENEIVQRKTGKDNEDTENYE
jgi:hypothetical protein